MKLNVITLGFLSFTRNFATFQTRPFCSKLIQSSYWVPSEGLCLKHWNSVCVFYAVEYSIHSAGLPDYMNKFAKF